MNSQLLNYLACPECVGELRLDGARSSSGDTSIEEGALVCARCGLSYPILRGIPRFSHRPESTAKSVTGRTQRTYDFSWQHFGEPAAQGEWEKDSYHYARVIPAELTSGEGKLGLDAGCGAGLDLIRMAEGGAEIIGFDLSEGVETTRRLARDLPNVHVVQGDLHSPPFRPEIFDFIYSFGVLHHLPQPSRGFRALARLLKPGAPLITYLYEDFGDRTALERGVLSAIRFVRQATSRLPSSLLYGLSCLAAPFVWATCSVPARLLKAVAPRIAERIPFRHTLRWNVLASDLFDRFAPPVEWRLSREAVGRLYDEAGFSRTETRRYRGWVSWGFKEGRAAGREDARNSLPSIGEPRSVAESY